MNTTDFEAWMRSERFDPGTIRTRVSNLVRVESCYKEDLDAIYERDQCKALLKTLAYTKGDQKNKKANPSPIEISGDLYNGLATIRTAVNLFTRFRDEFDPEQGGVSILLGTDVEDLTFSLECDLQKALRTSIGQLEEGLVIIDGGSERSVSSGRIDILAQDRSGNKVVIELKSVRASREAVGQVLSYMGDIQDEGHLPVRGILVAPEFDERALSAARMVDSLRLVTYSYKFEFTQPTGSAGARSK